MKTRSTYGLQAVVLILVVGWVYWPAIHGGWVWDDFAEIVRNPVLRDPGGIRQIWLAPSGADYFPLKTTAQWVEWHLWGDNVLGYHLVNIGLHALSALLIWHVLGKLGVRLAYLGAFLFAVHPLAVESVAWISEFKNTLSLPFLLLAMLAWMDWERRRGILPRPDGGNEAERLVYVQGKSIESSAGGTPALLSYILSLVCFLAAMLAKSSVVMFPAVLLLYAWWRRGRVGRRDLVATAPFFAVSLVLGIVTWVFQQQRAIAGVDLATGGLLARCAGAGLAVAFYFGKALVPVNLIPHYPLWHLNPPMPWDFWPWVVMGVVFAGLVWGQRRRGMGFQPMNSREHGLEAHATPISGFRSQPSSFAKDCVFGLGWFVLFLLPVVGFIPMAYLRISWVADHFAYVPLVGLVALATAGIGNLNRKGGKNGKFSDSPLQSFPFFPPFLFNWPGWIVLAAIGALAVESHRHARIFATDEGLWIYTLERNPDSWTAHNDLGMDLAQRGRLTEAMAQYEESIAIKPNDAAAHMNLGNVLVRLNRIPEAMAAYAAALRLEPRNVGARTDLGNALVQSGQYSAAIDQYEQVMTLKPDFSAARYGLAYARYKWGNALGNDGRYPEAIDQYTAALRLRPDYAEARANLGLAFANTGRSPEAILQLEAALRLKPDYEQAQAYLGFALAGAGRMAEAIRHYEAALKLNPDDADVHYNLGLALRQTGRIEEANAHFEAATRLSGGR